MSRFTDQMTAYGRSIIDMIKEAATKSDFDTQAFWYASPGLLWRENATTAADKYAIYFAVADGLPGLPERAADLMIQAALVASAVRAVDETLVAVERAYNLAPTHLRAEVLAMARRAVAQRGAKSTVPSAPRGSEPPRKAEPNVVPLTPGSSTTRRTGRKPRSNRTTS